MALQGSRTAASSSGGACVQVARPVWRVPPLAQGVATDALSAVGVGRRRTAEPNHLYWMPHTASIPAGTEALARRHRNLSRASPRPHTADTPVHLEREHPHVAFPTPDRVPYALVSSLAHRASMVVAGPAVPPRAPVTTSHTRLTTHPYERVPMCSSQATPTQMPWSKRVPGTLTWSGGRLWCAGVAERPLRALSKHHLRATHRCPLSFSSHPTRATLAALGGG